MSFVNILDMEKAYPLFIFRMNLKTSTQNILEMVFSDVPGRSSAYVFLNVFGESVMALRRNENI